MLGVMRSRRHVLLIVSAALLLGACTSPSGAAFPTTSTPSPTASDASGLTAPSVSISLPVPSGGSSSATGAPTATPSAVTTDVRSVSGDAAAFSTPSGRMVCLLSTGSARCEYVAGDKAWTSPKPANCELDWGSALYLGKTAGSLCAGDTVADTARLDGDYVGWRRTGDPTATVFDLNEAALPYGSSLSIGTIRCDSATTGITCRNAATGHGFTMSREAYSIF